MRSERPRASGEYAAMSVIPELLQGAVHLRQLALVDFAPRLVGVPVGGARSVESKLKSPFVSMTSRTPWRLLIVPSSSTKNAE